VKSLPTASSQGVQSSLVSLPQRMLVALKLRMLEE
jgi:hypothetical protein